MSRKLTLIAGGVLSALALTALPCAASAGEPTLHCTSLPCNYTVTGTGNLVATSGFGAITCKTTAGVHSVSGTGSFTNISGSTGQIQLLFHDCREPFGTGCQSAGQPADTITTPVMVTHNVSIEPKAQVANGTPGMLLTNYNLTYTCGIGVRFTKTGTVIGHIEDSGTKCNIPSSEFKLNFETGADGTQKFKQITTTGQLFDILSASTAGGTHATSYSTQGLVTTWHIKFNQNVTLTC